MIKKEQDSGNMTHNIGIPPLIGGENGSYERLIRRTFGEKVEKVLDWREYSGAVRIVVVWPVGDEDGLYQVIDRINLVIRNRNRPYNQALPKFIKPTST